MKGNFVDDKKNGLGKMTWEDGRYYEGMWQDGRQEGEGTYFEPPSKLIKGIWSKSKLIRQLN